MVRPIVIVGQTGSGKHAAAEAVADRFGCTLISIDSMKVYRGMDIGTAKPRRPYRLIDLCDPAEPYNAGKFVRDARAVLGEVERPLLVGGTALYYKALAYGLHEGPEADPALRGALEAAGAPALHRELERVDPVAAVKIHRNDLKRLVRAVEVWRLTGEPISARHTHFSGKSTLDADVFGFRRADIRDRIASRTRRMIASGLVDEVRGLLGRPWANEARRAVGYREVIDHLEGRVDVAGMERLINTNTWHLAKHQWMWFKKMDEIVWVDNAEDLCSRLGWS